MKDLAEIEGDRVRLLQFRPEDVTDAYIGWLNDPGTNRYLETRHSPQTRTSARAYARANLSAPDAALWRICFEGRHVGNIRLSAISRIHARAVLAILIGDPAARGQGVGTEAVKCLTAYAHRQLDLLKVTCGIYAGNAASIRMFTRAGFSREATLRQHVEFEGRREDVVLMASFASSAVDSTGDPI